MLFLNWPPLLGVGLLAIAVIVYLVRSGRPTFPIVLAVAGVFFCGAAVVKLALPGGTSVEFDREVAAAAKSTDDAAVQQTELVQQLDGEVVRLSQAVQTLQTAVNQRLSASGSAPVQPLATDQLQAGRAAIDAKLQALRDARVRATAANTALVRLVGLPPGA